MLRDADIALDRAKSAGRACVELFDVGMRDQVIARLQLETDLRWALGRGELVLDYQPIIALADQTCHRASRRSSAGIIPIAGC